MRTTNDEFIGSLEACRMIPGGIDRRTLAKLAARVGIRCRVLPGQPVRYHRGDIEDLVRESVRKAQ